MNEELQKKLNIILGVGVILLILFLLSLMNSGGKKTGGLAGQARFASTTNFTVSSSAIRLTATSSCAARIITVQNSAVNVTFSDFRGDRPTATVGHLLSATSSPYVFTAEDVGCGAVFGIRATGLDAPLTITETF